MKRERFRELLESVREAGAIERGELPPSRVFRVRPPEVVEIAELPQPEPPVEVQDPAKARPNPPPEIVPEPLVARVEPPPPPEPAPAPPPPAPRPERVVRTGALADARKPPAPADPGESAPPAGAASSSRKKPRQATSALGRWKKPFHSPPLSVKAGCPSRCR